MVSGSAVEMEFQSHQARRPTRPQAGEWAKRGIISYQLGADVKVVRLERQGESVRISIDDQVYDVQVNDVRTDEVVFSVNGMTHTAFVASAGTTHYVAIAGDVFELKKPDLRRAQRKQQHGEDNLSASMPGQVTRVLVNEGDTVQRGQPLIVLEAMKMEIKIAAPHDGRVTKVLVKPGQVVERGQGLIEMTNEQ
jgi:3-methylcrotonyl-CoA carboxylase alpha subunit